MEPDPESEDLAAEDKRSVNRTVPTIDSLVRDLQDERQDLVRPRGAESVKLDWLESPLSYTGAYTEGIGMARPTGKE